jgi:hypothetical protein
MTGASARRVTQPGRELRKRTLLPDPGPISLRAPVPAEINDEAQTASSRSAAPRRGRGPPAPSRWDRLGWSLRLRGLRMLGFCLDNPATTPVCRPETVVFSPLMLLPGIGVGVGVRQAVKLGQAGRIRMAIPAHRLPELRPRPSSIRRDRPHRNIPVGVA